MKKKRPNLCAAANGGGPSWLQSARLVAAVAELGSFGKTRIPLVMTPRIVSKSADGWEAGPMG